MTGIFVFAGIVLILCVYAWVFNRAQDGWEDGEGFHRGREGEQ